MGDIKYIVSMLASHFLSISFLESEPALSSWDNQKVIVLPYLEMTSL
jgi:hypothetical protein